MQIAIGSPRGLDLIEEFAEFDRPIASMTLADQVVREIRFSPESVMVFLRYDAFPAINRVATVLMLKHFGLVDPLAAGRRMEYGS